MYITSFPLSSFNRIQALHIRLTFMTRFSSRIFGRGWVCVWGVCVCGGEVTPMHGAIHYIEWRG